MDEIFQRWVLHQHSLHQFRGSYDFMAAEGECFVHEILVSFVLSGVSPDFIAIFLSKGF